MARGVNLSNDLYVAKSSNLSAETYIDTNVDDFDIVRAPASLPYDLVVLVLKGGKVYAKYMQNCTVVLTKEITECAEATAVRAVRGETRRLLILTSNNKQNKLIVGKPKPLANTKGYNCAISILAY